MPAVCREIIYYLKDENEEFHTYQLSVEKSIRIGLRNLHPTTHTIKIKAATK